MTGRTHERRVVAILVVRNEAGRIGPAVRAAASIQDVSAVVAADGGSTDGTVQEGRLAGADVISVPAGGGKGGALEEAFDRLPRASVYLLLDGDVGETAAGAAPLLSPVLDGDLDLCIGCLPPQPGGGLGVVKATAGALIRRSGSFAPREPLSGQRAVTREALEACRPFAPGFGLEAAMTMDAVRLGFRVGERPVEMRHRPTGRDLAGFVHRGRQGVDVLRAALPRLVGIR